MSNQGTQEQNKNRNNNRNRNRNRGPQGKNRNSNYAPRPQSQHQQFVSRKPVKLTLWQKLMKLLGFYKEPNTSKSDAQRSSASRGPAAEKKIASPQQNREPRNNTRDARKEPVREPRPPRERKPVIASEIDSTRLYLGNLSYETAETDLEELFKGIGPVRSAEVVYNRHTHKSKGYGFVEMLRLEDAKRAVEVLHDQPFMGRNLVVSSAKAKDDSSQEKQDDPSPVAEVTPAPIVEETVAAHKEETNDVVVAESDVVEEVHTFSSEEAKKETFV